MAGALKIGILVVLGVWAAHWLSQEEYGEKRFERIIRQYVEHKAQR